MQAIIDRGKFFWTSSITTINMGTCMSVKPGVLSCQRGVIIESRNEDYLFFS